MKSNENDNYNDLEMCFVESVFLLAENIVSVPACLPFSSPVKRR